MPGNAGSAVRWALAVTWLLCREMGADPEASLFERTAVRLAPVTVGVAFIAAVSASFGQHLLPSSIVDGVERHPTDAGADGAGG